MNAIDSLILKCPGIQHRSLLCWGSLCTPAIFLALILIQIFISMSQSNTTAVMKNCKEGNLQYHKPSISSRFKWGKEKLCKLHFKFLHLDFMLIKRLGGQTEMWKVLDLTVITILMYLLVLLNNITMKLVAEFKDHRCSFLHVLSLALRKESLFAVSFNWLMKNLNGPQTDCSAKCK